MNRNRVVVAIPVSIEAKKQNVDKGEKEHQEGKRDKVAIDIPRQIEELKDIT